MTSTTLRTQLKSESPVWQHRERAIALGAFGLAIFLLLAVSVVTDSLFVQVDQSIAARFDAIANRVPEWFASAVETFSRFGSEGMVFVLLSVGLFYILTKSLRPLLLMLMAVAGAELAWLGLIFIFGRPRPDPVIAFPQLEISLPSFPSGHTILVVAFWGLLVYLYLPRLSSTSGRIVAIAFIVLWGVVTGFARLFLDAHYFTDIIAGYAFGLAWAIFSFFFIDWVYFRWRQQQEQDASPGQVTS